MIYAANSLSSKPPIIRDGAMHRVLCRGVSRHRAARGAACHRVAVAGRLHGACECCVACVVFEALKDSVFECILIG